MHMKSLSTAALFIVLVPVFAVAHSTGYSFEKKVGDHIVDVGYDTLQPVAGQRLLLDFTLRDTASSTVPFDYVWVRLDKDKQTLLATGIARAEFGPTSLLYVIPEGATGDLSITARFQSGDDALAETAFTIPVTAPRRPPSDFMIPIVSAIVGAAVAAGMSFFILRPRNRVV